ncbi:MAG: Mth938-like domain-containing protein [Xanthobacteraceae bacterium]
MSAETPHLPYAAPIEAYGKGGFRFAGMSHRGSLLCLPDGIWAWPPVRADEISEAALEPVFARADEIGLLLIGAGSQAWAPPASLFARCYAHNVMLDMMRTAAAVPTYNILLGEGRRVAAGLIAVD